jgi:uncharacterized protein
MDLSWLRDRTILVTRAGSRAYGTNRPDSDVDIKGVCIAPRAYRDGFLHSFDQANAPEHLEPFKDLLSEPERAIVDQSNVDGVIFGLPKFMKLAAECNPNVIETLFVADEDVLASTVLGQMLRENRELFLSQKAVHTFRGYAVSQLKRIRTHRNWCLHPVVEQPTRAQFGLPERTVIPADQLATAQSMIQAKMNSWSLDFQDTCEATKIAVTEQIQAFLTDLAMGSESEQRMAAGRLLGFDDNFLELLARERAYQSAQQNWSQYQNWKATRNAQRAAMEAQFGYDGKHALHLVRLLRMCREILETGTMHVRRPDAEDLKTLLKGAWTYERLIEWATQEDEALLTVAKTSSLPKRPPLVQLDALCQEITRMADTDL